MVADKIIILQGIKVRATDEDVHWKFKLLTMLVVVFPRDFLPSRW